MAAGKRVAPGESGYPAYLRDAFLELEIWRFSGAGRHGRTLPWLNGDQEPVSGEAVAETWWSLHTYVDIHGLVKPSQKTLRRFFGVGERTIRRSLSWLVAHDWLVVVGAAAPGRFGTQFRMVVPEDLAGHLKSMSAIGAGSEHVGHRSETACRPSEDQSMSAIEHRDLRTKTEDPLKGLKGEGVDPTIVEAMRGWLPRLTRRS